MKVKFRIIVYSKNSTRFIPSDTFVKVLSVSGNGVVKLGHPAGGTVEIDLDVFNTFALYE